MSPDNDNKPPMSKLQEYLGYRDTLADFIAYRLSCTIVFGLALIIGHALDYWLSVFVCIAVTFALDAIAVYRRL